jgi:hypothetical protein
VKPAQHLKPEKSHLHRPSNVQEDNKKEALVTDVRPAPIFPSSKNTMGCRASPVPGAAFLIFLFPAMKKRISLKLRLSRTATTENHSEKSLRDIDLAASAPWQISLRSTFAPYLARAVRPRLAHSFRNHYRWPAKKMRRCLSRSQQPGMNTK